MKPLVSVLMLTYNHEEYIVQAINGVLNQDCNFLIELIISDDNSTDQTGTLVKEFIDKGIGNKVIINYIHHSKNIGVNSNFSLAFQECRGKYIALCEGDDYWTNNNKLQLQVDFLESNLDYALCFHNSICFDQNINSNTIEFPGIKDDKDFAIDDFLSKNFVPTASVVFTKDFLHPLPLWYKNILFGDYAIYLLILFRTKKKAYYLSNLMSVYRLHNNGVFTSLTRSSLGEIKKV